MFYKLIEKKRNEWIGSPECTVKELLQYIIQKGQMRDAQIEAVKTYLFLKIACGNRPLWQLFVEGTFNSIDVDALELTVEARQILLHNKAAVALLEYSQLKDKSGRQLAPALEQFIKAHANEIDYEKAFRKIFYDVSYTDYLFSLPMGAGKTYLMAAFIYIDLYFAQNEPDNPCFAHNFMVMAPSGLKSSIVPSLKNIKEFDPSWVIPEPAATQLRRLVKFEILDEQKSANRSNRIKNPNAQKINNHQPFEDLMGLVAITNAEKVILDRVDKDVNPSLLADDELKKIELANELRHIIGRLPNLAIYIDEVHHAADGDIKLRQVVGGWTQESSFNSVLGFSGTPYLESAESVVLGDTFSIKNTDLANVVNYYPLIQGVGNFLKVPTVKYADNETGMIVQNGVEEFLDNYRDLVYPNGTCAKLAIYCGQIETLEEKIFPLVTGILAARGMDAAGLILKYHGGNKAYPQPEGAETEFASLDASFSKIRIILLVQIGKEGWDCKSLTGVILPQKGACPTNMVLQTSCRCLRQVTKHSDETALVWLNKFNADTLNKQLKQQQNITLQELNDTAAKPQKKIERFSRMEQLHVPPIDYYQLKVSYETFIVDKETTVASRLKDENILQKEDLNLIHQQDLAGNIVRSYEAEAQEGEAISFLHWLQLTVKESFNTLPMDELYQYKDELQTIFRKITVEKENNICYNPAYNQTAVRSLIRQAFSPKRSFKVKEEVLPRQASLLQIEKLTSPITVNVDTNYYPPQEEVHEVMNWDSKPDEVQLTAEALAAIELLKAQGIDVPQPKDPHPERKQTYHYLPYHFDSRLETDYFAQAILPIIKDKQLEAYFNGDDTLTEFKIDCYKQAGKQWQYIGRYVPDFLLLKRTPKGVIDKVIIIETKGEGFAAKFADRRQFMETEFVKRNNEKFGYERFSFLYIEDTLKPEQREQRTVAAINQFFN